MFDPAMLFEFLDDWLEKDTIKAKDNSALSSQLLNNLSDLAVTHELLAAVRQFRPFFQPISLDEACIKGISRAFWRDPQVQEEAHNTSKASLKAITKRFIAFQDAPFPKGKRDKAWLEQANKVRLVSKNFWTMSREILEKQLDASKWRTNEDKTRELAMLSFDIAPEHLAVLETEREAILRTAPPPTAVTSNDSAWTPAPAEA